jgi:Domain of unknown function (DUF1841)
MRDTLQEATLLSFTLNLWRDYRRGVPMSGHNAAIAYAMQHHNEWWAEWDSIDPATARVETWIENHLIHIHNDAAVKTRLDSKEPKELTTLYQMLREKGFDEFESIHTLAVALTEETWLARENNGSFNMKRYVERTVDYVKQALSRPNLARNAGFKAY